jgi:hypothetical protein
VNFLNKFSKFNCQSRSSDSAKYTNKSSGTSSILSANLHHPKFYAGSGNRHHHRGGGNGDNHQYNSNKNINSSNITIVPATTTAPVHKKFVSKANHSDNCSNNNNNNNNKFINRFINKSTHLSYSNHYSKSLSLNRHVDGVGCITLTSPYAFAGNGFVGGCGTGNRGTKSDIGAPIINSRKSCPKSVANNNYLHKSNSIFLPSVHSELSLYDVTTTSHPKIPEIRHDILNNNCAIDETTSGSLKTASSKLLYTNKHRLGHNNHDNPTTSTNDNKSVSYQGPLVYKNDIEGNLMRSDWNNSVFDNPIMTVSQKCAVARHNPIHKHFI